MIEQTDTPDGPAEVFRSHRARRVKETELVLQAMGIPCEVVPLGAEAAVVVGGVDAERARREIELYERENRGWPHPEELPEVLGEGLAGVAAWVGVLLVTYALERNRAFGLDWWESGKSVAALVRGGELWRALTSLTLHDDIVHLVGNIVFGAIFVGVVAQVMGPGLALATVLLAGWLGNLANAWVQDPHFSAIGASTAVFGALGILGGHRWQQRSRLRLRRALIPLVAMVFLLGYSGMGGGTGERVDVLGHALGFGAGLFLGSLHGRFAGRLTLGPGAQSWILLGTGAAVALAWWLAL